MAIQHVTYDEIERMKSNISLNNVNGSVISGQKEAFRCPLSLVCYPSCSWWQDGKCVYPGEGKSRTLKIEGHNKWLAALQKNVVSLERGGIGLRANRRFIEYFGNTLLTATSCALLWFLGCIWIDGAHYIQEPNIVILGVETAALVAILGFAIQNLARIISKKAK